MAREQLEKDLHSTKAQLRENGHHAGIGSTTNEVHCSDQSNSHINSKQDVSHRVMGIVGVL